MSARARRRLALFALAAFAAGLTVLAFACGYDGMGTAPVFIAPPDTSTPIEASTIPMGDGSIPPVDAGMDVVVPPTGPCPSGRGPLMVPVPDGGFCIDSTEVTNEQYDVFLATTNGGAADAGVPDGGLPPQCNGTKTFARSGPATDGGVTTPVTRVSWCAGAAYCGWAGKRLCAGVYGNAASGEWYAACSLNGTRIYPYGNAPEAGICNETPGSTGVEPVASKPGCVGGVPGVFDMAGNVRGLIDSCSDMTDAASCTAQGTAYVNAGGCFDTALYPTGTGDAFTGFRCCADKR